MTVLFEDEALYTAVKIEAVRRNLPLKDLVTTALRAWIEAQEDAEILPVVQSAREEWQALGGTEASVFFDQLRNEKGSQSGGV